MKETEEMKWRGVRSGVRERSRSIHTISYEKRNVIDPLSTYTSPRYTQPNSSASASASSQAHMPSSPCPSINFFGVAYPSSC
eukprot:107911-Hanusia_phi.AAC.2